MQIKRGRKKERGMIRKAGGYDKLKKLSLRETTEIRISLVK